MTIEELATKVENIWQTLRRHKHQGQAIDLTEELEGDGSASLSPSASVSPSAPIVSGFTLVNYLIGSANSIIVTGLDLDTDLEYEIRVQCRNIVNGGIIYGQCNADGGAGKHRWINQGYHATGGETNSNSESDSRWEMNMSNGGESHTIAMNLSENNGVTLASWRCGSVGYSGDSGVRMSTTNGAGYWNDSANITSFSFTHNSGNDCDWRVWVLKANT